MTLEYVISAVIVIAFIIVFCVIAKRRKSAIDKAFAVTAEADAPEVETPDSEAPAEQHEPVGVNPSVDSVFGGLTPAGLGDQSVAYDVSVPVSITADVSFEEKVGKDTVTVQLPGAKGKPLTKRDDATPAELKKPATRSKPATAEELVKFYEQRIARRIDVLKVAGMPESSDRTLAKYRANLADLKKAMAKAKRNPGKTETAPRITAPKVTVKKEMKAPVKKAPAKKAATRKAAAKKPAPKAQAKAADK